MDIGHCNHDDDADADADADGDDDADDDDDDDDDYDDHEPSSWTIRSLSARCASSPVEFDCSVGVAGGDCEYLFCAGLAVRNVEPYNQVK